MSPGNRDVLKRSWVVNGSYFMALPLILKYYECWVAWHRGSGAPWSTWHPMLSAWGPVARCLPIQLPAGTRSAAVFRSLPAARRRGLSSSSWLQPGPARLLRTSDPWALSLRFSRSLLPPKLKISEIFKKKKRDSRNRKHERYIHMFYGWMFKKDGTTH